MCFCDLTYETSEKILPIFLGGILYRVVKIDEPLVGCKKVVPHTVSVTTYLYFVGLIVVVQVVQISLELPLEVCYCHILCFYFYTLKIITFCELRK